MLCDFAVPAFEMAGEALTESTRLWTGCAG
jgi:hypothetical protein